MDKIFSSFFPRRCLCPKITILLWCFVLISNGFTSISAQGDPGSLFNEALTLQNEGDTDGAFEIYHRLIMEGYTEEALYHNLALISMERNQKGKAVLYYERCIKHISGADICAQNLRALRRSIDSYEVGFASVKAALSWNKFVSTFSSSVWGILAITAMLLTGLLYFYRKSWSFSAIYGVPLLISFFLLIAGFRRYYLETTSDFAIVTTPGIELSQGPDPESKLLYPLQEGTRVKVIGSDGQWKKVLLLNRDIGWLKEVVIETI